METSGRSLPRGAEVAAPTAGTGRPPGARRRALLAGCGWGLGAVAGFAVYLRLAQTRAVNSDGAAQALQAWDMLHGNPLLRGWTTSDVSFYTTELPQYMLIELTRGLGAGVVHIAAAMTYTLVVLLAALVARGTATGRQGFTRAGLAAGIMLAPQLASGTNVLVSSPDHIGTSVPLLAAWLILDRARPSGRTAVAVSALLAWALIADTIVLIAGVGPLLAVCAYRMLGGTWRYELRLAAGALAAVGAALAAGRMIRALGGYTVQPLGTQIAPLSEIFRHNLPITAQCLLLLPGADFLGLPRGATAFFVLLHLAGVGLALAGITLAGWRLRRREDLVSQLLLAGIAVNVLAFIMTTRVYGPASAREIAPALPYTAALAGRQLGGQLLAPWPGATRPARGRLSGRDAAGRWLTRLARPAVLALLVLAGAGYLAGLGLELTTASAPPQAARLTAWLERHPLGTGLSGYWEASVVTLTSGGRVAVRPVTTSDGRVIPVQGETQASWYDPRRGAAHFVVLFPGLPGLPAVSRYPGFTNRAAVLATFGPPARAYHVGGYTILSWPGNLLRDLRAPGRAATAGARS